MPSVTKNEMNAAISNTPQNASTLLRRLIALKMGTGVVPEIGAENVAPGVLGFAVMAVLVNRKRVDRVPVLVGQVGVAPCGVPCAPARKTPAKNRARATRGR